MQSHLSKEDARHQVLRILCAMPYGNSVFFTVRRIEDPIGLLPGKMILGINKRGVHFFRPVPKEYLHSAELRDIMQFGSSANAVFFKMRVAGVLHIFQFDTKQGESICVALQAHINDVMLRRYSRRGAALMEGGAVPPKHVTELTNGEEDAKAVTGNGNAQQPQQHSPPQAYKKLMADMAARLEQANKKAEELAGLLGEREAREWSVASSSSTCHSTVPRYSMDPTCSLLLALTSRSRGISGR